MKETNIEKFRRAFLGYCIEEFSGIVRSGGYDKKIESFLNGDVLEIRYFVQFFPNRLAFFNFMLEGKVRGHKLEKLKEIWKEELQKK